MGVSLPPQARTPFCQAKKVQVVLSQKLRRRSSRLRHKLSGKIVALMQGSETFHHASHFLALERQFQVEFAVLDLKAQRLIETHSRVIFFPDMQIEGLQM